MRRYRRRLLCLRRLRDDHGVAMLYVISLILIGVAALTPLSIAVVSETRESGRFRQSNAALSAAEGQLDAEIGRITSAASSGLLPCTGAPVTEWTGVDGFSVTTTISYQDGSGTDLGCPVPSGAQPTTAVVRAVATTPNSIPDVVPVRRVMQSTLRLAGAGGPGAPGLLPSAIFGNNVSTRNGMTLTAGGGSLAPSPRIYANGDFTCTNGMSVAGSILAQGKVTAQNGCTVNGDIHSVGDVTVGNGGSFGGDITASAGSVSLGTGGTVAGSVYASGTVSGCLARCYPFTPPAPPPREDTPAITWDAVTQGAWQHAGWTLVSFDDPRFCTVAGRANGPAQWLIDNGSSLTSPTLVHTTCKFVATNAVSFTFNQNVAVIADGGADFGNAVSFTSSTAGSSFYLIQPQNAVAQPCTGEGLGFGNASTISAQLVTLLYSPCDIEFRNAETMTGQVYAAGQFIADNGFTMTFAQLPVPGQGTSTPSYSVSVTSKYEAD